MKLQTFASILCLAVLLLVCAVSASRPASTVDGSTTLRASTLEGGSHLLQAAGASGAPVDMEQPSWVGSIVLIFGGCLGGLWLLVGALSALRGLRDFRPNALDLPQGLSPSAGRGRKDEAPSADLF